MQMLYLWPLISRIELRSLTISPYNLITESRKPLATWFQRTKKRKEKKYFPDILIGNETQPTMYDDTRCDVTATSKQPRDEHTL